MEKYNKEDTTLNCIKNNADYSIEKRINPEDCILFSKNMESLKFQSLEEKYITFQYENDNLFFLVNGYLEGKRSVSKLRKMYALGFDIDTLKEGMSDEELYERLDEVEEYYGLKPHIINKTLGGYHIYFLLEKTPYIPFKKEFKKVYNTLNKDLGGDEGFTREIGVLKVVGGYDFRRKGYIDRNNIKYPNIEIPGQTIDNFVWEKIETFLNNPDLFYKNYVLVCEKNEGELDKLVEKREFNKYEIQKQNKIIENVETDFYAGNIDIEKRDKYIDRAEKQITILEKENYKLDIQIENILKLKISKQIIENLSAKFGGKITEFSFEQKKYYIDLLIDKIIISNEDDIKVDIYFRFDPIIESDNDDMDELKKSIPISKDTEGNATSMSNGRKRETRTHNPALPKRVRYQLRQFPVF